MTAAELLVQALDAHADRVAQANADLRAAVDELVPQLARAQLESALAKPGGSPPPPAKRSVPRAIVRRDAKPAKPAAAAGPTCSKCRKPGHNARTCGAKAEEEEEEEEEEEAEEESDLPANPRLPAIFSRPLAQPMTAIAPVATKKLSPAELDRIKARIRERRAREEAREAPRPIKPRPIEPEGPTPFVAALPVPIATFTF